MQITDVAAQRDQPMRPTHPAEYSSWDGYCVAPGQKRVLSKLIYTVGQKTYVIKTATHATFDHAFLLTEYEKPACKDCDSSPLPSYIVY